MLKDDRLVLNRCESHVNRMYLAVLGPKTHTYTHIHTLIDTHMHNVSGQPK